MFLEPEIIDTGKLVSHNHLGYRVAFSSIVAASGSGNVMKDYSIVPGDENVCLEFYVNGIRTEILPFFKRVEDNFDNQVNNAARELAKEKLSDIDNLFHDLKTVVLEKFPNIDED
jgi:hypothetical protein